jgi:hypothetical protein
MNIENVAATNQVVLDGTALLKNTSWGQAQSGSVLGGGRGLVIADAAISDLDVLVGQLEQGTDLWRVESGTDVGRMLKAALSGGYDRLHFLGHGQSGAITFGGKLLDIDDFKALSNGSASAPSLHFWSCLTGAGLKGRAFVDGIAEAFGSVVTAFTGLVGARSRGGSWLPDVFSHEGASVGAPFENAYAYAYTMAETAAEIAFRNAVNAGAATVATFKTFLNAIEVGADSYAQAQALYARINDTLDVNRFNALKYDLVSNWGRDSVPGYASTAELWGQLQPLADLRIAADNAFKAAQADTLTLAHFNAMNSSVQALSVDAKGTWVSGQKITDAYKSSAATVATEILSIHDSPNRFKQLSDHLVAYAKGSGGLQDVWYEVSNLRNIANASSNGPVFTSGSTGSVNENALATTGVYTPVTTDVDIFAYHTYTLSGTDASLLDISSAGVVTLKASANYEFGKISYSFNVIAHDGAHDVTQAVVVSVANVNDITTTISGLHISADTGTSSTDFLTKTASQTITGTLSAALGFGEKVQGSVDNGTNWIDITSMVTGAAINWTGVTLSGTSTIKLRVVDASNNSGTAADQAYVLDMVIPTTTISGLHFSADTGTSNTDFITNTAAQTISGTLSAVTVVGEVVKVSLDNGSKWVTATNTIGQNSFSLAGVTLTGSNTLKVQVEDAAGNAGAPTSQAYVLDTVVPTTTISGLHLSQDTGTSPTDFITNTAAQTITGTLSAALATGESLFGSLDNGLNWQDITNKVSGTSITADGAILTGSGTMKMEVRDAAGNAGPAISQAYLLDTVAPTITSGATATAINENSGAGQVVYTATSTDSGISSGVTYSLKSGVGDAALLSINSATGAVTLTANPNYESKASYSFTVFANDGANTPTEKAVTLAINNLDEVAPTITSGATATAINENSGAGQVVYTATSTDTGDISAGVTYSLKSGVGDAALLSINTSTGAVKLTANPDFEVKSSYSFTVLAGDGVNTATEKAVTLAINNLPDNPIEFTSGGTGSVPENAVTSTVIYQSKVNIGTNAVLPTYSLSGADAGSLNINTTTGAITLQSSADYETQQVYHFNVIAADGTNTTTQAVEVLVGNLNDSAPVFTSLKIGSVNENAATSTVVYTATTNDADHPVAPATYTLSGTDSGVLTINSATGAVTLQASANFEAKASYSFNVIANDGANNTTQAVVVSVNNMNDAPTGAVTITGEATQDKLLTASNTLADEDGLGTISYQWYNGSAAISKATDSSYTLTKNEVDGTIKVVTSYTDGRGTVESVPSSSTAAVQKSNSGVVSDGYLSGALVWIDTNGDGVRTWTDVNSNGKWDAGEGDPWTLTDNTGQFKGLIGDGTIHMTENTDPLHPTVDISTGKSFTGSYSAPSGSTVVTPLTTLVVAAAGVTIGDDVAAAQTKVAAAQTKVAVALGLDTNLNLKTYDPVVEASKVNATAASVATALKVQSATIQVANIIDIAASVTEGAGGSSANTAGSVATALMAKAAAGNGTIDLANVTVISDTVTTSAKTVVIDTVKLNTIATNIAVISTAAALVNTNIEKVSTDASSAALANPLQTIDSKASLTNIVKAQIVAQETATQAAESVQTNTNKVTLTDQATLGTQLAAVTPDQVKTIIVNHAPTGVVTITGTPITGETLTALNSLTDSDGLGTISYQWYKGSTEISGATVSSYTLTSSEVGQTIRVAASFVDGLGNAESLSSSATTAVLKVPSSLSGVAVVLKSTSDSGLSTSDGITNVTKPTVTVDLTGKALVAGDIVQIIDSNNSNAVVGSLTVGATTAFVQTDITLSTALSDGPHALRAQVTDALGNIGLASKLAMAVTVDTVVPAAWIKSLNIGTDNKVTATLGAELGSGDHLFGTVNGGAEADITASVIGTAVTWDVLTAPTTIKLEVRDSAGNSVSAQKSVSAGSTSTLTMPAALASGTVQLVPGTLPTTPIVDLVYPEGLGYAFNEVIPSVAGLSNQLADSVSSVTTNTALIQAGITAYVATIPLANQPNVTVRTISFTDSTLVPFGALEVNGATGHHEALVINTSGLASDSYLNLNDVDFAIIVGNHALIRGGAGNNIAYGDDTDQNIVLGAGDDTIHGGGGNDYIGSLAGNDQLFGDAGNDTLSGGDGNDSLYGGDGNDLLTGGAGNNLLDGGADDDTAVFSGNYAQYTIGAFNSATQSYTITGTGGSIDTLTGIEHLKFADQTIADPYANIPSGVDNDALLVGMGALGLLAWVLL